MFTGIIEATGEVKSLEHHGSNISFWIESPISSELRVDQSLSHNGVCLTVEAIDGPDYKVTAIDETLKKTNLGQLKPSDKVNLERCMQMNGRLDGHIVQGHADGTATCITAIEKEGSWEFSFKFEERFAPLVIEKGSITINGVSLTLFNVRRDEFTVAIIPYTFEHTNLSQVEKDAVVNIEFDMIGKYVNRMLSLKASTPDN